VSLVLVGLLVWCGGFSIHMFSPERAGKELLTHAEQDVEEEDETTGGEPDNLEMNANEVA